MKPINRVLLVIERLISVLFTLSILTGVALGVMSDNTSFIAVGLFMGVVLAVIAFGIDRAYYFFTKHCHDLFDFEWDEQDEDSQNKH